MPETIYDNCNVYAAVYDENGTLIAINYVPLETSSSTNISVRKSENDALIKIFIWYSQLSYRKNSTYYK